MFLEINNTYYVLVEIQVCSYTPTHILVEVWDFDRLEQRVENAIVLWCEDVHKDRGVIKDVTWTILNKDQVITHYEE